MAVSKTLLSPRGHSRQREGKRRARAHSEPMDTEGVSFGARVAFAGSVVAHRARFFSRGPREVRDGRWSEGRRARGMVAVDVAIAHRGPRDVAGWSVVGGLAGYVAPILGTDATAQRSRCGTAAMAHAAGEAQYAAHASMSLYYALQQHAIRHARPVGMVGE